jgi:hypothetical protein
MAAAPSRFAATDKRARSRLSRSRDPSRRAHIVQVEPVERALRVHPVGLVGIVAGAEVDDHRPVAIDYMFEHRRTQHRAGRVRLCRLVISEFVDGRDVPVDRPQLRCDRAALIESQPEPQRTPPAGLLGKGAQESG